MYICIAIIKQILNMALQNYENVGNTTFELPVIPIKIVSKSGKLPEYATKGSAGMDIRAYIPDHNSITILPGERKLIPTGLYIQLLPGYEAQIRPRSGLALKYGITVLNAPGTIDSDYRGEIGVILYNAGNSNFMVNDKDRIAQMVLCRYDKIHFIQVEELDDTDRSVNGFGHTGVK